VPSNTLTKKLADVPALKERTGEASRADTGFSKVATRETGVRVDGAARKSGGFLEELKYSESRGDANGGLCYRRADVRTGFKKVL
jgi:hypothetical protein